MNNAKSLSARLNNYEKEHGIKQGVVLRTYVSDKFLERVSLSKYKKNFVLKGGLLIASIIGLPERATMDIDATIARHSLTEQRALKMVSEIAAIELNDGFTFSVDKIDQIREDAQYTGYRISLTAHMASLIVPLKLDLTAGDVITLEEIEYEYQMIIDERVISIFGYTIESVLAEKYETVLRRGVLNTRMKDFYDIFVFVKLRKSIDLKLFMQALEATSLNRGTVSNVDDAKRIIGNISRSDEMQKLWQNYKTEDTYAAAIEWAQIIECLEGLAEL